MQRPVVGEKAITVPGSKKTRKRSWIDSGSIRLIALFFLVRNLACAWNPYLYERTGTGYDRSQLEENTQGEQFGEMTPETLERFKAVIRTYWQSPYLWGGNAPSGIDCSGLIGQIYRNAAAITLPRTTLELYSTGLPVKNQPLQFADLVFFSLGRSRQPDHVGFYVARGYFIHASVKSGVTLSLITDPLYRESFVGARRLMK